MLPHVRDATIWNLAVGFFTSSTGLQREDFTFVMDSAHAHEGSKEKMLLQMSIARGQFYGKIEKRNKKCV